MNFQHAEYASGKWFTMSLCEQMGNIGSEIERTISWRNKGNKEYSIQAFYRALELLYFTIKDQKNRKRLCELTRVKEVLIDYFLFDNQYQSSDRLWQNYFYAFAYAARNEKRRQRQTDISRVEAKENQGEPATHRITSEKDFPLP